jgi:hypothetical protein
MAPLKNERVRGRSLFRQTDMERAVRGAKASGFEIGSVEVGPDGTIRILAKEADQPRKTDTPEGVLNQL